MDFGKSIDAVGNYKVLNVSGDILGESSIAFGKRLEEIADQGNNFVAVNFENVPLIDSFCVEAMLAVIRKLEKAGGAFAIVGACLLVKEILVTTSIQGMVQQHENLSEFSAAINAL